MSKFEVKGQDCLQICFCINKKFVSVPINCLKETLLKFESVNCFHISYVC